MRIALGNLRFPATPDESVALVTRAIAEASRAGAGLICFPECYVPGYRGLGTVVPLPDQAWLDSAWAAIAAGAKSACVAVVLGTERIVSGKLLATALVIDENGVTLGFQDKVQLDPSEDETYSPGSERHVFQCGDMTLHRDLPRRMALSGDGAMGGSARRAGRFPSALSSGRGGWVRAEHVRGSGEHVSREGDAVPRGGEHVLVRVGELRERGVADDIRGRAA